MQGVIKGLDVATTPPILGNETVGIVLTGIVILAIIVIVIWYRVKRK